jgi:hypothetical protein
VPVPISRVDIEDVVKEGIAKDIFRMEQAFELLKRIGERANDINNQRRGRHSKLFGIFQTALKTESILAAARVYDTPSTAYPTRCLRGVLQYLVNNNDDLPSIREPYQLQLSLQSMGAPTALLEIIENEPKKFAPEFAAHISSLLDSPLRVDALDKLKTVRDKAFAHNEQASRISGPTWESLQDLIHIAKKVVGVMGWAYFSTAYVINGQYILTDDARRPTYALDDLLDVLYNQE